MEEFVKKVGIDKIAHFGVAGVLAAVTVIVLVLQETAFKPLSWLDALWGIAGVVVAFVLGVFKEVIDDKWEWADIWAGVLGSLLPWLALILGIAMYYGSK